MSNVAPPWPGRVGQLPDAAAPACLLPGHISDLRESGLTEADARAAGLYSETDPAAVGRLLNWSGPARAIGPCLVFPFPDRDGRPTGYARVKPDNPRRDRTGKPIKYESPRGQPNRLYVPPRARAALSDPAAPLIVTEGEKKALAAGTKGFACVGLVGVSGWQTKRDRGPDGRPTGPRVLIPDLAAVPWVGRPVFVAFDSDAPANPNVLKAERALAAALAAAGADVRVVRLSADPGGAKVGLDDYLLRHTPDNLRALLASAARVLAAGREKAPPAAELLTDIGMGFDLFRSPEGVGFAAVGQHSYKVRSRAFEQLLRARYRERTGKAPGAEALATAANMLDAEAVIGGPVEVPHVRAAESGGRSYLALGDAAGTVVEVGPGGWNVSERPPVRFLYQRGLCPLPIPGRGGSVEDLRPFLNLDGDQLALVVAWLTSALRGRGPFPLLALTGEQGSAKTTAARVLKRLVDPTAGADSAEPKEVRDLMVQARNRWVLVFDNLSGVPVWLSDALCRLSTGGGFSTRALFTDDDEIIFDAQRPVILTGIDDLATRGDLLERSLLVRLSPIPDDRRRTEEEFWAAFDAARPRLLGALLGRLAGALAELPRVCLDRLPRMADFARLAVAAERAAGGTGDEFLSAYAANQADAHEQALEDSPLVPAVRRLMDGRDRWEGSPRELLDALAGPPVNNPPKNWPKRPQDLSTRLRRLAPALRRMDRLDVQTGLRGGPRGTGRRMVIARHPGQVRESAPAAPAAPEPPEIPGGFSPPFGASTAPATGTENAEQVGDAGAAGAAGADSRTCPGAVARCVECRAENSTGIDTADLAFGCKRVRCPLRAPTG